MHKTLHETPEAALDRIGASARWPVPSASATPACSGSGRLLDGLKPHLVKTFKLSNDEHFVEKVRDIVGLYLDPPDKALVLSVDEKSQIQALDRTQPGLPIKKGRAGTMTHDYKRRRHDDIVRRKLDVATIRQGHRPLR